MSLDPATLLAILAMAAATYLTRVAGLVFARYIPATGRVRAALDALPTAVLVAVIAPAASAGPAEIVATALTVLAATRLPVLGVVAVGVGSVVVMRALVE
ncbi:AzlD domain-containing protein [Arenibaculum pallidiluteum]|uniref:AzlD domain-containing protein n=1 Tax=Arenibaculum pallidiluteum TaxID=2812559 RepID=UPI001A9630B9|nr:AzlD domain-containing protein [Arenibaculum pallidiluteum]